MDHAKRGVDAMSAGNYSGAVDAYSLAIKETPLSPDYYIKRSTAYQRSSPPNFDSALADAETAVILAQKRAKRELIVQAQLRRAIALFGLERYGDSSFVFEIVKRMDAKEKTLGIWENKIETKLVTLEEDDPKKEVTVKEIPEVDLSSSAPKYDKISAQSNGSTSAPVSSANRAPTAPAQTPANKIRHDWYQNNENVYFTLLAKGVPKDKANIDIQERSLSISFPLVTDSSYEFALDPLFAAVDVSKSTTSIFSTKVEIVLKKAQPGQKWSALESSEPVSQSTDSSSTTSRPTVPLNVANPTTASSKGPSYPTSSRSGPKNWDKLASDLTAKKPKKDSKDGESKDKDDDDDWDYEAEGGDEVNGFFKKLYAGASPDVQKAMMKSFTESNGTALSTNWDEVKKGKVETQPPDGMEARKWG